MVYSMGLMGAQHGTDVSTAWGSWRYSMGFLEVSHWYDVG